MHWDSDVWNPFGWVPDEITKYQVFVVAMYLMVGVLFGLGLAYARGEEKKETYALISVGFLAVVAATADLGGYDISGHIELSRWW